MPLPGSLCSLGVAGGWLRARGIPPRLCQRITLAPLSLPWKHSSQDLEIVASAALPLGTDPSSAETHKFSTLARGRAIWSVSAQLAVQKPLPRCCLPPLLLHLRALESLLHRHRLLVLWDPPPTPTSSLPRAPPPFPRRRWLVAISAAPLRPFGGRYRRWRMRRLTCWHLLLTAVGPCSGITADMVAEAVEHGHGFPRRDICVAPCFPEDFVLVLSECHQRDLVFERRQLVVAGVKLLLRPWFPPPGGNRVWRLYCRVAIEGLPLNAWSWDNVQEVIGKKCRLDLIERQSTTKTNVSALFAWLWAWDPNLIPRVSDFNVISRPDVARPRRSLPEGTPSEQGREGPHFPVLIHLDVVTDYTPMEEEDLEWPRIYEHKDWKMGTKDGERRARAAVFEGHTPTARRNDDDADDGYNGGARRRGKRSGARDGFWQGMRDRANYRDAAARAPAPRRYRRHVDTAVLKTPVIGTPVAMQQLPATATVPTATLKSTAVSDEQPAVHLHIQ
ncbi:hypothetical protein ZWY2020_028423 [Hordeum vulgare]|nr:hypothetical protein ZWY2020_028423 [Hordeum vulgare]